MGAVCCAEDDPNHVASAQRQQAKKKPQTNQNAQFAQHENPLQNSQGYPAYPPQGQPGYPPQGYPGQYPPQGYQAYPPQQMYQPQYPGLRRAESMSTFRPTRYIWVVVANEKYEVKRSLPGFEGFQDIAEVREDMENIKKGVQGLGARMLDIKTFNNASFQDLKELQRHLVQDLNNNAQQGERTCVFYYYAGHGMQNNYTFAVLNEKRNYNLEQNLRILASIPKAYVVALLDCCREKLSDSMRGGNTEQGTPEDEEEGLNLVITFGCPPSAGTPAKSTIATAYFDRLRKKADFDGSVIIPEALLAWRGTDGKCETLPLIKQSLKLMHENFQPSPEQMASMGMGMHQSFPPQYGGPQQYQQPPPQMQAPPSQAPQAPQAPPAQAQAQAQQVAPVSASQASAASEDGPMVFHWLNGPKFNNTIVLYDKVSCQARCVTNDLIKLRSWYSVKVGPNLLSFGNGIKDPGVTYEDAASDEIGLASLAAPPVARQNYSLYKYTEKYMFACSGQNPKNLSELMARCDYYDIENDRWGNAPDLNVPRYGHCGTSLGENHFVFAGADSNKKVINSIEYVNAAKVVRGESAQWNMIETNKNIFDYRMSCLACPFSETEIVIFGGKSAKENGRADICILDTTKMRVKLLVRSGGTKVYGAGNQCFASGPNKVTALVSREDSILCLVSYTKGTTGLVLEQEIGPFLEEEKKQVEQARPSPSVRAQPVADGPFIFHWLNGPKFNHTIITYDQNTRDIRKITNDLIKLRSWYSVKIGQNLLSWGNGIRDNGVTYENAASNEISLGSLAKNPVKRQNYSLANFKNKALICCSGQDPDNGMALHSSCNWYNIAADTWHNAPDLVVKRYAHTGCSLGNYTYVFAGANSQKKLINSIEVLDADACIKGDRSQWQLIETATQIFDYRMSCVACPIGEDEILIFGGRSSQETGKPDVCVLNTTSRKVKLLIRNNPNKYYGAGNQCFRTGPNQVTALVSNSESKLCMVQYNRGDAQLTQIKEIGAFLE